MEGAIDLAERVGCEICSDQRIPGPIKKPCRQAVMLRDG